MIEYARAFAEFPAKAVWIQEFGCCDLWGSVKQRENYLRQTVDHAVRRGATVFTFWCSHDKTPDLQFDEMEYCYGLIDTGNQVKPLGDVYRTIIEKHCDRPPAKPPAHDCMVVVDDEFTPRFQLSHPPHAWVDEQASSTLWTVFHAYLRALTEGYTPAIALRSALPDSPNVPIIDVKPPTQAQSSD
jgi:hypothetical protein